MTWKYQREHRCVLTELLSCIYIWSQKDRWLLMMINRNSSHRLHSDLQNTAESNMTIQTSSYVWTACRDAHTYIDREHMHHHCTIEVKSLIWDQIQIPYQMDNNLTYNKPFPYLNQMMILAFYTSNKCIALNGFLTYCQFWHKSAQVLNDVSLSFMHVSHVRSIKEKQGNQRTWSISSLPSGCLSPVWGKLCLLSPW